MRKPAWQIRRGDAIIIGGRLVVVVEDAHEQYIPTDKVVFAVITDPNHPNIYTSVTRNRLTAIETP